MTTRGTLCASTAPIPVAKMADKADDNDYFHFDSWRQNLQPGVWLPVGVYVEEDLPEGQGAPGLL